jgi:hypothetical protein
LRKHFLVPIFSETKDTAESVLSRNTFLFDTIVAIGCRAEQGLDSNTFRQIQSRLREHHTNLLVNIHTPSIEEVQAISLMAAYSDNGYVLVALALRFAVQLGLPNIVDQLLARTSSTPEIIVAADHELYRLARIWLGICNLELLYDVYWVTLHSVLLTVM